MRKDRDRQDTEMEDPQDADGDEARPDDAAVGVETEVDEVRQELDALNDRHMRLAAEFDNYRKRNERERQVMATRLQVDLVSAFLDVIDDLERVAESGEGATVDNLVEGVRLVEKKFMTVLSGAGLVPIDAEGSEFDPETMEAMLTAPTDDPEMDGRVADVFQKGYRLGDVLVRPARVRVLQHQPHDPDSE